MIIVYLWINIVLLLSKLVLVKRKCYMMLSRWMLVIFYWAGLDNMTWKVIHHGRDNTYEVHHKGNKHIPKPWEVKQAIEIPTLPLVLMNYRKFYKETNEATCYLLCRREGRGTRGI